LSVHEPSQAGDVYSDPAPPFPSLIEAFWVWTRIALLSFGGPAGQIAVMHRILVEEKRWIGEKRFLHALNFCMLLPGPEAQQLSVYIGWLLHRTAGGLIAGLLFVLPGLIAIMALSWLYVLYGNVGLVAGLFFGLKAAVLAIVLQALVRIGGRALHSRALVVLAGGAFVAIFVFGIPFPLIIATAAANGYGGARAGWRSFAVSGGLDAGNSADHSDAASVLGAAIPSHARPSRVHTLRVAVICLFLWLAPLAGLLIMLGPDHVFSDIAAFFSALAVLTFGGAYAVLAWVAQEAVGTYGWLMPGEMLDGLGMAETTPGPLIMVTQFVGFMAAFRDADMMPPLLAGTLGGLLATWVTFAPCFLWVFFGAPYAERLRGHAGLSAALTAITAAVVGVILNLALWFSLHVLFAEVRLFSAYGLHLNVPVPGSLDPAALLFSAAALLAVFRFKWGMLKVIGLWAAAGMVFYLLAGL